MSIVFDSLSIENRQRRSKIHALCCQYNTNPNRKSLTKLKDIFFSCGKNVFIESGFICDYGDKISLGERVFLNFNCTLLDGGKIQLADDVLVGPNVQILTVNHPLSATERLKKINLVADVTIEKNVWIGAGSIILPGVSVGENCVIGAGSVVSKDLQTNGLYVGNPAVKIRRI